MYTCDSRCYDYGNGHICKHVHRVHSLQQIGHQETSEVDLEHHPAPVYYPSAEQPIVDDTSSQGKLIMYQYISIKNYQYFRQ